MNKKLAVRNLMVAVTLVVMAIGMTLAFLGYIQFFRLLPR